VTSKEIALLSASGLARWGGLAAMLGGVMWVVKGGAIMLTGEQPPILFEAALPLFAVGLVGLHARLGGRGGRLGKTGLLLESVFNLTPKGRWPRW
jgi:hypothetical protein